MKYVLDTNSISVLSNYYPDILPTFWDKWNEIVDSNFIFSTEEVYAELMDP